MNRCGDAGLRVFGLDGTEGDLEEPSRERLEMVQVPARHGGGIQLGTIFGPSFRGGAVAYLHPYALMRTPYVQVPVVVHDT